MISPKLYLDPGAHLAHKLIINIQPLFSPKAATGWKILAQKRNRSRWWHWSESRSCVRIYVLHIYIYIHIQSAIVEILMIFARFLISPDVFFRWCPRTKNSGYLLIRIRKGIFAEKEGPTSPLAFINISRSTTCCGRHLSWLFRSPETPWPWDSREPGVGTPWGVGDLYGRWSFFAAQVKSQWNGLRQSFWPQTRGRCIVVTWKFQFSLASEEFGLECFWTVCQIQWA